MDNFDLKKYLAEGRLHENEEQGYTLYTTNVEYDNGKTGYMFQLVNSEDREENEIGFDQLFFDDEDNRLEMGVDFNSFDQGSYQEGEYTADEAMELYRKISEGVIKEEVDVLGNEFTQEIQDDMKMYYKMDVDMDDIKDWVNMYYIGYNSEYDEGPGDVDYEGNEFGSEDYESEKKELVFDTAEREDFYMHLNPEADSTFPNLGEGRLLKEESIKDIENSWHGVIEILYSKDDFKKIMNAKKFEDLEEEEQALMGRALRRWERESGKNMNVADYFKAVRNDLTTLSKNL